MGRPRLVQEHHKKYAESSNALLRLLTFLPVPLILKGVQRWEDALKAYDLGLAGVVLSNHGGRQLDFARSGIEVLVEVVTQLKEKRGMSFQKEKLQILVEGGVRRATDVLKAIALGATAVGVGRPFLYAFSSYGQEGAEKALQILHVSGLISVLELALIMHIQDEFEMNMRLLGATSIANVTPDMVDTSNISSHIAAIPGDRLYEANCTCDLFSAVVLFACADNFSILRREHATCSTQRDQTKDVERRYYIAFDFCTIE